MMFVTIFMDMFFADVSDGKQRITFLDFTLMCCISKVLIFTKVGEFWSGQKDSEIGQWPTGTPVLGLGRT